ncbi:MAG: hypothetical protein GY711_19445 [bacterium]|nr:hypothetical protein [bacterium]
MKKPLLSASLFGLVLSTAHADIVWTGAVSDDIFDEANWDLSGSTVTVVDPNVTIDDDVVIANTTSPVEIPDGAGQVRFQVGDGFTLTLDNASTVVLGNDGIGGIPMTMIGPELRVINGGSLGTFFITNGTHLDLDATSTATFGGPNNPINLSTVDLTFGSLVTFTDEDPMAFTVEHLSKTTVDGAAAVVGVNLQVVSDGAVGSIVTVIPMPVGTSYCGPAIPNSTSFPGEITGIGSPVADSNALMLTASQLPPGQFGYFLVGQTQGFFNPPGSQGLICLNGNIGRYNQIANIIQGPTGSIQADLTALPVNPPQAAMAGETWNFQCWYRDLNPTLTSNFTDGLTVTFQ